MCIRDRPGAEIQQGVQLAHMLWIPFFPLGKKWILKQGGQSYEMNAQVEQYLNQTYGKASTPWYAFTGFFLVFLAFGYMKFQDANRDRRMKQAYAAQQIAKVEEEKKTAADLLENIKEPSTTDYYSICLLYTSPSPRDATLSRMPSSA